MRVVTTDQSGQNLPQPAEGDWEYERTLDNVAKELTPAEVTTLEREGWVKVGGMP
jgi:hypothetical protein